MWASGFSGPAGPLVWVSVGWCAASLLGFILVTCGSMTAHIRFGSKLFHSFLYFKT